VLATDIDPRHLDTQGLENLEVRRHDILRDPLPQATFDLVHTRLVLSHLADPDLALERMVTALKPGGWLVVEDFEVLDEVAARGDGPGERVSKTAAAMRVVAGAASDRYLGRSLARRLRARGLMHVDTEGRSLLHMGRSAGARLMRLNFQQLRDRMLATGQLSIDEFNLDVAALDDEQFEMRSPIMWTAWGQRPQA
jgi:SAM-dependent methyltransferase